mmetsp:Transcript_28993/g.53333  ORF Transcript_28993/g.53333 Transcript_28993/m.53333 type:complete len:223 (-) Transcript_28993:100-768(-)
MVGSREFSSSQSWPILYGLALLWLLLAERAHACFQKEPLLYGCEPHKATYQHICCNVPQHFAEHRGFASSVNFYKHLEDSGLAAAGPITFYDSQCGLPLYIAPRGRTYEEWKREGVDHGWPSFRDEEFVLENLDVDPGYNGEIVSKCKTHLGHNFPDQTSNRHCINLMCMAGIGGNVSVSSTPGTMSTSGTRSSPSPTSGCCHLTNACSFFAIVAYFMSSWV